jgi:hypothetical protein
MRVVITIIAIAVAGALRSTIGHEAAYLFLGLCVAVPRIMPVARRALAGIVRVAFGHDEAYVVIGLWIAIPRVFPFLTVG